MPLPEPKPDLLAGSGDCYRASPREVKKYENPCVDNNAGDGLKLDLRKLQPTTPSRRKYIRAKITPRKRSQTLTDLTIEKPKTDRNR